MILFVDYEHTRGRNQPWGERVLAARTWISYRLQEISGEVCVLQHYTSVSPDLVERLGVTAVVISGNGTDPADYEPADLDGLQQVIRSGRVPLLGLCGGHQLIATTLGSGLRRLGRSSRDGASDDPGDPSHWEWEHGYRPIDVVADHPLLDGVEAAPVMRHAHSYEIDQPPPGFRTIASTELSVHQLIVNDDRRVAGTQFHPEYYTDEHPAGRRLIANFCAWSGAGTVST